MIPLVAIWSMIRAAHGFLGTSVNKFNDFTDKVTNDLGKIERVLNALGGKWIEMQDIAFKTSRSMAMGRDQAMRYDRMLMQTTKELARQYGLTAQQIADFQKEYASNTGRNIILTQRQTEEIAALSRITDDATANELVDSFDKIGIGIARATASVGAMQERAKALGLNATKATKTFQQNIKLASSYSFRNGVRDIEKMALKATSLRMDMSAIMNAADKFMDIEGAISTSANIQMLGGSFAQQFSNPMGAMYEAMADPKEFMNRIERTIEGKGTYNQKTGEVKFDPVTMMQLREMAKQLGMSVEQITEPAMVKTQNEKIDTELRKNANFSQFSDIEQDAIRNLSRNNVNEETGKHQITYLDENGREVTKGVDEISKEELKIAQDRQMTEEAMFSDVQEIKDILDRTLGRARGTTSTKENISGFKEELGSAWAQIQNFYMGMFSGFMNGSSFQPWDFAKGLTGNKLGGPGYVDIGTHGTEGFGNIWTDILDIFGEGPGYYAEGGIVKANAGAVLPPKIVPGDSYTGDKVPVMANSGEMILNQNQQKGLFDLIGNVAKTGLSVYLGNKIGNKLGIKGFGTWSALGGLLSGKGMPTLGGMAGNLLGMFTAGKLGMNIKGINPMMMVLMQMMGMNPVSLALMNRLMGGMNPMMGGMNPIMPMTMGSMNPMMMGGGFDPISMFMMSRMMRPMGGIPGAMSTVAVNSIGKRLPLPGGNDMEDLVEGVDYYEVDDYGNPLDVSHGKKSAKKPSKFKSWRQKQAQRITGFGGRTKDWFGKNISTPIKDGTNSLFKFIREKSGNVFRTMNTRASGLFGKARAYFGKGFKSVKGLFKTPAKALLPTKSLTAATKAVSGVSKVGGALKFAKIGGKAIPVVGTALSVLGAGMEISAANENWKAQKAAINASGASKLEKARALDSAEKERNKSIGGSVGMAGGALAGAAIGSVIPGIGTLIGGAIGGLVGAFGGGAIGKGIGGLFGGGREKEVLEAQKANTGDASIYEGEGIDKAVNILASIDSKLYAFGKLGEIKGGGNWLLGKNPFALTAAIKAASHEKEIGGSQYGNYIVRERFDDRFKKVVPSLSEKIDNKINNIGPTNINLNISGTIKLEGGGKTGSLDISKLLDNHDFKNQISQLVANRINEMSNAGKRNKESERNNMAAQYDKSGK